MDTHEQYLHDCNIAFNERCKAEASFLYKENYLPWLQKYSHLRMKNYNPVFLPLIKPQDFNQLYYQLSNIAAALQFQNEAKRANDEYALIEFNVEKDLIDWLCLYEKLADKIFPVIETNLNSDENAEEFETGFIAVDLDYNVKIAVSDYKEVLNFLSNYYDHYWNVVRKYDRLKESTYDPDEQLEVDKGKELREIITDWETNNSNDNG
jgi:hypothetical protein